MLYEQCAAHMGRLQMACRDYNLSYNLMHKFMHNLKNIFGKFWLFKGLLY